MINQLVGMKLEVAKAMLEKQGKPFEVTFYNDKKMKEFDETLVLRASNTGDKILLVATNFLFVPQNEA